jgi:hypothetical protein
VLTCGRQPAGTLPPKFHDDPGNSGTNRSGTLSLSAICSSTRIGSTRKRRRAALPLEISSELQDRRVYFRRVGERHPCYGARDLDQPAVG